ncbi:MAG: hypothetical protein D6689_12860 [Deltaproteobacteria bacterium]|nr:MAG: hypothetical protein D6689_12860 [Deltaproteobacteria bacterium]
MRVTESRLIQLASDSVSRARQRVAAPQAELSSGVRVSRPSDDVAAWVAGRRARAGEIAATAHGDAIARSRDRLARVDQIYGSLQSILQRTRELAVAGANDTLSADDRAAMAAEVRALQQEALRIANERGADGEPLLAGTAAADPAFDATGTYMGNANERQAELLTGFRYAVGTAGTPLTAVAGVDVFQAIDGLAVALETNNTAGVQTSIDDLAAAHDQIGGARADVGARIRALDVAEDARQDMTLALAEERARAIDADPVDAASRFAGAMQALEAARAVAQRIISMFRG